MKLVESVQKPIEERQRVLERAGQTKRPVVETAKAVDHRPGNVESSRGVSEGGFGFLENLRKLKDEMYLD